MDVRSVRQGGLDLRSSSLGFDSGEWLASAFVSGATRSRPWQPNAPPMTSPLKDYPSTRKRQTPGHIQHIFTMLSLCPAGPFCPTQITSPRRPRGYHSGGSRRFQCLRTVAIFYSPEPTPLPQLYSGVPPLGSRPKKPPPRQKPIPSASRRAQASASRLCT